MLQIMCPEDIKGVGTLPFNHDENFCPVLRIHIIYMRIRIQHFDINKRIWPQIFTRHKKKILDCFEKFQCFVEKFPLFRKNLRERMKILVKSLTKLKEMTDCYHFKSCWIRVRIKYTDPKLINSRRANNIRIHLDQDQDPDPQHCFCHIKIPEYYAEIDRWWNTVIFK
jgi:hypothetical protein